MKKSGNFGMACHQALSFSPLFLRLPKAEAVFWPGCALMNLDPAILEKTLEVLRRAEPEIRLAPGCCGQPSAYLFPEAFPERSGKVAQLVRKQGIRRIYTACPNCTVQLRRLEDVQIVPIWGMLAEHLRPEDLAQDFGRYIWHDPCPTRGDSAQQAAVREILKLRGCDCTQPEHTGCMTRCCGNFHMMHTTDPEKSRQMRKNRLAEFPEDRTVCSSCEGCLGAFRSDGRDTAHLLELLFGRSGSRGWGNRIRTTFRA